MFLAEKRRHPSPLPLLLHPRTRKAPSPNPNPSARSFDLALALGLRSLLPLPPAPLPLSWFARATDLLASTLAYAAPLLSRPSPSSSSSSSDPAALAAHLRSGLALLDTANSLSAALHLLLRRRLLLRLRLSSSPSPDSLRLAIAEWDRAPLITIPHTFPAAAPQPPRPSASAARRAIYAADAVDALVLPAIAAALGGAGAGAIAIAAESTPPLPRVPAELPWAAEFNELAEEIPLKLRAGLAAEIEAVDDAVRRLTAVVDGYGDVDPEKLRRAAEEAVTLTEEMTEGLDRLSDAVNGLFRAAMLARNAALDTFRIGPQKCR